MQRLKPFVSEMEKQGIVFLNISLDRKEKDWIEAVERLQFGGVHTMADGDIDSDVAKKYEIRILPQYYLINKNGSFAERPPQSDMLSVRTRLSELSR